VRRFAVPAAVALLLAGAAAAQVEPVVRVELDPPEVTVGESARLRVTILVPTWFARPPVYPSLELANAITRLPPDSSFPTSERIGGQTWSGIVRDYRIYPLLGATYRLDGESIEVAYANPGAQPVTLHVPVPGIILRGTVPRGAENLSPYVAGRRLDLSVTVEGDLDALEAGDAVVLRYVAELQGLPAMFLPPLAPALEFDGAAVYADEPSVQDGDFARREEKITLVFEAGGKFTIPGIELDYWNLASQSVEAAAAPGLEIAVAGPPAATATSTTGQAFVGRRVVFLLATLLAIGYLGWRLAPRVARCLRATADRRRASEPFAFGELGRALRTGNARAGYPVLLTWLERLAPGMASRDFAATYGDDELRGAIDSLVAANFSASPGTFDPAPLRRGLRAARRRYLNSTRETRPAGLPGLNP